MKGYKGYKCLLPLAKITIALILINEYQIEDIHLRKNYIKLYYIAYIIYIYI